MRRLTDKQEAFALSVATGSNLSDALRGAWSVQNMSRESIWVNASRLAKNAKVALRIQELRAPIIKASVMTVQRRKEWLSGVIQGDEKDVGMLGQPVTPTLSTRLKASDQLNHMDGLYVTKIESRSAQIIELIIRREDPNKVIGGDLDDEEGIIDEKGSS